MKKEIKTDQNTVLEDIDIITNPTTETLPFRYILASHWCKNKDVLDAAMGAGYGSFILQGLGAKSVTGFDIDTRAIEHVNNNKSQTITAHKMDLITSYEGTEFLKKFDTIISIETFEHLPKDKISTYLNNLKLWCQTGGTIFITTPRRRRAEWKYDGGTHLYEYSFPEFVNILEKAFKGCKIQYIGIKEVYIGVFNQLISILDQDIQDARIMCGIITFPDSDSDAGI